MSSISTRSVRRNSTSSKPKSQDTQTFVVLHHPVTLFTIIARIWWFMVSLLPLVAFGLITWSVWEMQDALNDIAASPLFKQNST